jgi:hypothetical protein
MKKQNKKVLVFGTCLMLVALVFAICVGNMSAQVDPEATSNEQIDQLIDEIENMDLNKGTIKNMVAKLKEAKHLLKKDNDVGAAHKLMDLIDYINAQVGKKLNQDQADYIVGEVWVIIGNINGE